MKKILLGLAILATMAGCNAQKIQSVPDDMKPFAAKATGVTVDNSIYTLYNGKTVIGYAVYSKPASDGIQGFHGEVPLIIFFDTQKKISQVAMLPNQDTPKFVNHVKEGGLLNQWNGLTVSQARKKKVDVVSGATFTSKGVINTFGKAIENVNFKK